MPKRPTSALDGLSTPKKKGKEPEKPKSKNTPITSVLDRLGMGGGGGAEPAPAIKADDKKAPKFRQTITDHHTDGSHTVKHIPRGPEAGDEVTYAVPDLAGVHKGFDKYLGESKSDDK